MPSRARVVEHEDVVVLEEHFSHEPEVPVVFVVRKVGGREEITGASVEVGTAVRSRDVGTRSTR
jgi:hypothetical protein